MSCEVKENCLAYDSGCWTCKYAASTNVDNAYIPIDKSIRHPQAVKAREDAKLAKRMESKNRSSQKSKERSDIVRKAAKVEDRVKATLNSGRINRDGDMSTKDITIDVKYQSTTINPTISAEEFRKIQNDAKRGGKRHGVLFIVAKDGAEYVVMSKELFSEGFVD